MLQTDFWPAFATQPSEDQFVFMQDGALPLWSRPVRDWLGVKLPNKWAGRGADTDLNIKWPPSSPNLTPFEFFLCGYIKIKVYVNQSNNIEELNTNTQNAFGEVTQEVLNDSMRSFQERLKLVVQSNEAQTELKLK